MPARAIVTGICAVALLAGCAPLSLPFYAGDESAGRLVYDSCSLGVVPAGLTIARSGIVLLVSVQPWGDDEVVHVRFDVGGGHRVQLAGREVIVDLRDGSAPRIGSIDGIDLWDRVPDAGYESLPARRAGLAPPDLPMDDSPLQAPASGLRPRLPERHYWIATHVRTGHAERIWVTLPELTVDGTPTAFTAIRFDRRSRTVLAPLNC